MIRILLVEFWTKKKSDYNVVDVIFQLQLSLVFFVQNSSCNVIRILVRILVRIQITLQIKFFGQMTSAIFALISQFSHTKWCWFTLIFVYTNNTSLFFLFFTFSAVASLLCHSHFFFVDIMKLFSHKSSLVIISFLILFTLIR